MRSVFSRKFGRGGESKEKKGGGSAGGCEKLWKSEGVFEGVWEGGKTCLRGGGAGQTLRAWRAGSAKAGALQVFSGFFVGDVVLGGFQHVFLCDIC